MLNDSIYNIQDGAKKVTVCIAAISDGMIIAASDRMLSAGLVEFEPPINKIQVITRSCFALIAGDTSVQGEALSIVRKEIDAKLQANPNDWIEVGTVAQLWANALATIQRNRINATCLSPLGLSLDDIVNGTAIKSNLTDAAISAALAYRLPQTETLIVGLDERGPHIYSLGNAHISCLDFSGFSAVGTGGYHASSYLMFNRQNPGMNASRTLYQVYAAKRHAEVAPGVGAATDMIVIGPQKWSNFPVDPEMLSMLQTTFDTAQKTAEKARKRAGDKTEAYILGMVSRFADETQASDDGPSDTDAPTLPL